jgi:hypothetical protein
MKLQDAKEGNGEMSDRYTCSITDTTVTIGFEGKPGSLTFGVGGPVAAQNVAGLVDEINALKNTLEDVLTHDAFAAELARLKADLDKYKKLSGVIACAYCGHESPKGDKMAIVEHAMTCDKRPEKKLLEKAFEVEDRLYQRIMHVTGTGGDSVAHYWPNDCETCKEIAETLDIYLYRDTDDSEGRGGDPHETADD